MKNTKRFVTVFLVALLVVCMLCIALTACHDDSKNPNPVQQIEDPETRPFSMSISTPDGVFNPFFSTSAYDSSVISLTQIGMLSTDKNGNIVYGDNEACVVKDMTETKNDKGNTVYEFLIKKGIKWSDGEHELTIKDVLFNLYVYLDPAYTGSATIYSTDIVGLQNYRLQSWTVGEGASASFELERALEAQDRITNDINFVKKYGASQDDEILLPTDFDEAKAILDYARIAKSFYEEINSDWNAINVADYDWRNKDNFKKRPAEFPDIDEEVDQFGHTYEYYEDFLFKEKWQIFLLNDAGYDLLLHEYEDGPLVKVDGNTLLDAEAAEDSFYRDIVTELIQMGLAEDADNEQGYTITGSEKDVEDAIKNICINSVFVSYFSDVFPMEVITRVQSKFELSESESAEVYKSIKKTNGDQYQRVLSFWVTASTILEQFTAEAKSDFFADSDKIVKSIPGVTNKTVTSFNGKNLGESYDVLSIEINGVDPKAIYNFSFNVAPMYYYSTTNWNNGKGAKDYINSFDPSKGEFGLEFGSAKFMSEVVNDPTKIKLPVGAGPYMATNEAGGTATSESFWNLNMIYYKRNPYFYTVGAGLSNAKIKYVRYKVIESDQIINMLATGNIDFGDPNATQPNLQALSQANLTVKQVDTNGYGYVGINPRFVPSINVRRAIMKAMDASMIESNYYQGGLCTIINRPMSTTNWAYPKGIGVYETQTEDGLVSYQYDETGREIKKLLEDDDYELKNGVYHKEIAGFGDDVLDYKFTIAGGSTDHPAYAMFLNAAKILNSVGFNVKVVTSLNALTDLSAGKLEVWAAAWSSTVDPDMFQVYHKDSQASSTKNWGYAQILGGTCPDAWGDEYVIVEELSELIDQGRAYTTQEQRMPIYRRALDKVMELAVEFPTYQRKDLSAYKTGLLDPKTLTQDKDITPYNGLLARIWEVNYL